MNIRSVLALLALAAAYLAADPNDAARIAELHRKRQELLGDGTDEESAHVAAFLRATEVAIPTADAKASFERLAKFLEANGDEQGKSSVPPSPQASDLNPPPAPPESPREAAPPADEAPKGSKDSKAEEDDTPKGKAAKGK